jgi:hypothetical protein
VLLRPADWIDAPFSALQALPSDARPITSWPDRDTAFEAVVQGIRRVIDDLLSPGLIASDTLISLIPRKRHPQDIFNKQLQSEQMLIEALPGKGSQRTFFKGCFVIAISTASTISLIATLRLVTDQ